MRSQDVSTALMSVDNWVSLKVEAIHGRSGARDDMEIDSEMKALERNRGSGEIWKPL